MKKIFVSSVFVLFFCGATFAQSNKISPCPTLSITGPAGISQPNEPVTFTADISEEAKRYDLRYRWSVSSGTIIEGQGTLTLKVLPKDLYDENITATIEVIGLPETCGNITASETMATICPPSKILADEFSISASRIDKARLDNFANELRKNPTAQGFIIELFDSSVSKKTVEAKSRKIYNYFTTIDFDKSRITILNGLATLNGLGKENLTQFFIVPAGATPPHCEDCVNAQP